MTTVKDGGFSMGNKLTNWESLLISTFFGALISGIVIYFTGSFSEIVLENGKETERLNLSQVIILIAYGAITLGTLIGFLVSRVYKKNSKASIERLNSKIKNHLDNL